MIICFYFFIVNFFDLIEISPLKLGLILIIMLLASLLIAYLYINLYLKKAKTSSRTNISFTVYTDALGKIIRACKNFNDRFDVYELFDKMLYSDTSIQIRLEKRIPFSVCLFDKECNESYIIFTAEKSLSGLKLKGEEATPELKNYFLKNRIMESDLCLGLNNVFHFYKDFETHRKLIKPGNGLIFLVELVNINDYKTLFGIDFYEKIYAKYAKIISSRLCNYGSVYALKNNKFVLLITDQQRFLSFKSKINEELADLNKQNVIENSIVKLNVKAGIVVLNKTILNKTIKTIKTYAKDALLAAKESQASYTYFNFSKSEKKSIDKHKLVKQILDTNAVEVNFQPQFNVETEKLTGFETLCRLSGNHSVELNVQEFIETCESYGYIIELGEYIFEKAFQFAKEIESYNVSVSLNISPMQILQENFVSNFLDKFSSYHLKKHSICIEITETFLVASFDKIVEKLGALYNNGIDIHLDDFGIGYSSMLYLKKLPINTIKIDREFVADVINNKYSRVICSKIIDIARELSLNIIAEGVETREQMLLLKSLDCKVVQGYLIGKAMTDKQAIKMLNEFNGQTVTSF